jgi:nitrous oxide reductase accessory protein NosL
MHTRHVLTEADGTKISFCSFTCAAKYMRTHEAGPEQLQVADYLSAELVQVKDAFYLLESDAPPVMSFTSIIAFAGKEEADGFQKLHGGRIMKFDEVFTQQ